MKIHKLTIANFYSIGSEPQTFTFENGLFFVKGVNCDATSPDGLPLSNGAGKSTLFNAVYQILYNKNLKDPKGTVVSVDNKFTKEPFKGELVFSKNGIVYTILHDRSGKYKIEEDGVDITPRGLPAFFKKLEEIIGFDFKTFTSLTYLNPNNLHDVVDLSGSNNLLNTALGLDKVKELQNKTKVALKETNTITQGYLSELARVKTQLEDFNNIVAEPPKPNKGKLEELENSIKELKEFLTGSEEITKLKDELTVLIEKENEITRKGQALVGKIKHLEEQANQFKTGKCPLCSSDVKDASNKLATELGKEKKALDILRAEVKAVMKSRKEKEAELNELQANTRATLNSLNSQYNREVKIVNAYNTFMESTRKIDSLKRSAENRKKLLEEQIEKSRAKAVVYKQILDLFKSGKIMSLLLSGYVVLLTKHIKEITEISSLDIAIIPHLHKGKLAIKVVDTEQVKEFNQLSSGERTRVSLIILLATLKALEKILGIELNFIVFDEIISSLDTDGVKFLKELLNKLKRDKTVIMISHQELEDIRPDAYITVKKRHGCSTIAVEKER